MIFRSTVTIFSLFLLSCTSVNIDTDTDSDTHSRDESQFANQIFDSIFDEGVDRDPVRQTYLGIKKDYGKWNDMSEENQLREQQFAESNLQRLREIETEKLDQKTLISYQMYSEKLKNKIADFKWRHHNYPVNQKVGTQSKIPSFLINQHSIANEKEAIDYISRLNAASVLIDQTIEQLKIREVKGIIAPTFVFTHVIRDAGNILQGAPFETGADSTLLADFKKKINLIELPAAVRESLVENAERALTASIKPAYVKLTNYLVQLKRKSDDRDGAWKFPDGIAFYSNALKRTTTTNLSSSEIHQLGHDEIKRIHNEMRGIMKVVNFEGDLAEFFEFMRSDPQFYYADNDTGSQRYLEEANAIISDMEGRLDSLFITKPKAELIVKRVESFRERTAGKAFYKRPAPDGSRPGTYYANLFKMEAMPSYQMAALAYHEAIPGHHMQNAIQQELTGLPKFRKFGRFTAFSEGWGLYSEMIPKEIGLYQDPYADFGRLAMELWRAVRLVVDTGIHEKKWTRLQSIEFYVDNTPNARSDAVKMVERHIVNPSQATAYKIGMLKIVELREKARAALGTRFDIRKYHDIVLGNGQVSLNVLENSIDAYIKNEKLKLELNTISE
ncbi:MAG: hypothetical protein ACI89U_000813 [Gammaproteobacteria bacterium]|jgi:uncharacterized protein (DUF885 family)